ncbi:MAG: S8 family serine peptidase [Candidatus Eisenbacteria bacterium]|nr:S8 family serine peptidase [Candidatus Eisenbacteria bacterium]
MKRFYWLMVLVIAPTLVFAQGEMHKLDVVARNVASDMPISKRVLVERPGVGTVLTSYVTTTLSRSELESMGIIVHSQFGGLFTAEIPIGLLPRLASTPGVQYIRGARPVKRCLDVSLPETGGDDVHYGTPPNYAGFTGRGVVVGSVDTGIDRLHQDFKKADGTTRIRYIWDQNVSGTPPAGYDYGTEWDSAQINAGACTQTDVIGHGSHTIGIAAGNGRATGNGQPQYTYVGEAPEANIISVKTTFYDTAITDGVAYIFEKAQALGMPAVVNLSLGSQYGPHDGTDPFDVSMNALTGPGRIICASAGNEGTEKSHAEVTIAASSRDSMTIIIPSYSPYAGNNNDWFDIDGWYGGNDGFSVLVRTPRGYTAGPFAVGTSGEVATNDGRIYVENAISTPTNGDREFFIEVWDASASFYPRAGTWTVRFIRTQNGETGEIDAWIAYYQLGASGYAYWSRGYEAAEEIGSPATADSLIAVGAYTTKKCWTSVNGSTYCYTENPTLGAIASFSSRGPRRDGVLKPNITAPGFGVASARSAQSTVSDPYVVQDGVHRIWEGTSMSAPHVAGMCAAVLQKFPTFTPSQMKSWLYARARSDGYTGTVPNNTWGYGKLDGSDRIAPQVTVLRPNVHEFFTPGTTETIKWVASDDFFGIGSVDIYYSTNGGATYPNVIATGLPNNSKYPWVVPATYSETCRVKIVATDSSPAGNQGFDMSDSLFTIVAPDTISPSVVVISPNGGEEWTVGDQDTIKWTATDASGVDSVSIYYSIDNGTSYPSLIAHGLPNFSFYVWTVPNTPSDSCKVKVVAYDGSTGANSGFDVSDSIFKIKSLVAVLGNPRNVIPARFYLAQNHPNPFNPVTGISFGLPAPARVSLKIYSVTGKLVSSLVEANLGAGVHDLTWDGRDDAGRVLASGIYFLRLEAGSFVQTRKMVMLR